MSATALKREAKVYEYQFISPVLVVRWHSAPTAAAAAELTALLSHLTRTAKRPIHYVGLIGESVPVADAEGRNIMKKLISDAGPQLKSISVVLEGSMLKTRMQRTIIDGLFFITRSAVRVHETGAAAIKAAMKEENVAPDFCLFRAKQAGLLRE